MGVIGEGVGGRRGHGSIYDIHYLILLSFVGDVILLTVNARCLSNDGNNRTASSSIQIEISQPLLPGTVPGDNQLEEICYHGSSGTLFIEENKSNVVIGTVSRCMSGNAVTRTYKVNKRKFILFYFLTKTVYSFNRL